MERMNLMLTELLSEQNGFLAEEKSENMSKELVLKGSKIWLWKNKLL